MFHDANFNVTVADIFDQNGRAIPAEMARGVYREDNGELIATCGSHFKPVQHMDVIAPVMNQLDDLGYEIEERNSCSPRALYDLRGKKGAFVSSKIDLGGARMRTDIILGDFVEPKGSMISGSEGENTMFTRITLLNSHDGSMAVHANSSYLRLICLNGMVGSKWSVNTRAKHTVGLNEDALRENIKRMAQSVNEDDAEYFGKLASIKVSPAQAQEYFERSIGKLSVDAKGNPVVSKSLVDKLMAQFAREDQTAWGLWNAMTYWASHGERKSGAGVISTTLGRENRVAAAMRSDAWDEVMAF